MLKQSVVYEPRNGYPLNVTAKRYWLPEFDDHSNDPHALTLIFLHSTSFHKETWEVTLEHVFDLAVQHEGVVKIREAWAIDCPNHGASAQLNELILQQPEFFHNCMSFPSIHLFRVVHSRWKLPVKNMQQLSITFFQRDPTMEPEWILERRI